MNQAEVERLRREVELLRKIADETKRIWDKGQFRREWGTLMNLLTDRIDFDERNPAPVR